MIILINANAHAVWSVGLTVADAQAEADVIAGYDQDWAEISRHDYDGGMGDRFIAVEVAGGDWSATDADHALSEGTVLGYWRVEDVLEHAA